MRKNGWGMISLRRKKPNTEDVAHGKLRIYHRFCLWDLKNPVFFTNLKHFPWKNSVILAILDPLRRFYQGVYKVLPKEISKPLKFFLVQTPWPTKPLDRPNDRPPHCRVDQEQNAGAHAGKSLTDQRPTKNIKNGNNEGRGFPGRTFSREGHKKGPNIYQVS